MIDKVKCLYHEGLMICSRVTHFYFSIIGAVRTGCFMLHVLCTSGFKQSVCDQSFYNGPISKFWACAFVLSKAPELGEAGFLNDQLSFIFLS